MSIEERSYTLKGVQVMGFVTHDKALGEVIVETYRQKHYIKVTAVHVMTGTEVSALCPVTANEDVQRYIALSKLDYTLNKRRYHAHHY